MKHSKLSDHTFKKGEFITPLNSLSMMSEFEDEKSWSYGRMPEYLWIGLILKYFGRNEGLKKAYLIVSKLHGLEPSLNTLRLSQILKLNNEKQEKLYRYIVSIGVKEAISPLTIIITASKSAVFSNNFYCPDVSVEERRNAIINTMREIMDHQSNASTDIRFVALYFNLLSGKIHLQKEQIELLGVYPNTDHDAEIMKAARPTVRSIEMMILTFEEPDSNYIKKLLEVYKRDDRL